MFKGFRAMMTKGFLISTESTWRHRWRNRARRAPLSYPERASFSSMSSSASASAYWRVAGMSYLKYSGLCADMVRAALKEPGRTKARTREVVFFRRADWKDGQPQKQSELYSTVLTLSCNPTCSKVKTARQLRQSLCNCACLQS